ncbi:MAG: N-acetyl-gamma-glutamyl-phosphate reductase [Candidatus Nitrospinota bacterium M3_3B_026]
MINAGVIGAAGYTGQELVSILLSHPGAKLAFAVSETFAGKALAEVFPRFAGRSDMKFESGDVSALAGRAEVVFLCLPHRESMKVVPGLLDAGLKVFDLSADFRLKDAAVYEEWYGVRHTAPRLLDKAVYGLPELYRDKAATADLSAVPGCYPTSAILGLAPLVRGGVIDLSTIVINSVSGVTGAGRKAEPDYMLAEMEGNFFAYGAPRHRHTPEIEQELSALAGDPVTVTFIPHLLPAARGIHTTITASLAAPRTRDELLGLYADFYKDERLVTVTEKFPRMKWAVGGPGVFMGVEADGRTGRVIVTSVIDNLLKGASSQAVQLFNIRHGLDEAEGLF